MALYYSPYFIVVVLYICIQFACRLQLLILALYFKLNSVSLFLNNIIMIRCMIRYATLIYYIMSLLASAPGLAFKIDPSFLTLHAMQTTCMYIIFIYPM